MAKSELQKARAAGNRIANQAFSARRAANRRRRAALGEAAVGAVGEPTVRRAAAGAIRAAGGVGTKGYLVAEGDSWFDIPGADLLDALDDYGYDIESAARRGHTLESMAYGVNQFEGFAKKFDKILKGGHEPKAILLSAGGNDVAGDEFSLLLDHALSPRPGLNPEVVAGVIDHRLRYAYVSLLTAITALSVKRVKRKVPILLHGYGNAVPDGRKFRYLGIGWAGPWLQPGFDDKGYPETPLSKRSAIVATLIARFNKMLKSVISLTEFKAHVQYIDVRPELPNDQTYKKWWRDELHPTGDGVDRVVRKFAAVLEALP